MTEPTLRISTRQFRANIEAVRARIAPSQLMLVLKDDAYGLGVEWAVTAADAAGVDWFGSYDVPTALRARRLLASGQRIFAWATSTDREVDAALGADIDLGIGSVDYLRRVIGRARTRGIAARVHLKIDTGLHRNGIRPEDWERVAAEAVAAEQSGVLTVAGVWSHLAEASDREDDQAQHIFTTAVAQLRAAGAEPENLHLTASAASWWRPELRGSLSRIGAFCYGIRSADGPDLDGIRPAAALTAAVSAIEDGRAVLAIGSFDGVPSTLAGATVGTRAGTREIVEIGAMATTLEGWPGMAVGDEVWLFGPGDHGEETATTLAERIGTVGEEIITRLTQRVRRVIED